MVGEEDNVCPICMGKVSEPLPPEGDTYSVVCLRCGEYQITEFARAILSYKAKYDDDARSKLSGWVRDQYVAGSVPKVNPDMIPMVIARPKPPFAERAKRLLIEAVRGQNEMGELVNLNDARFLSATYSKNRTEIDLLMEYQAPNYWMEHATIGGMARVHPHGYATYDDFTRQKGEGSQVFVAMWFDVSTNEAFSKGLVLGISNAGYRPLRIDRKEHVNKIDDEIVAGIKESRFLVADFTGHRGGVYFEAGFAMGLGLPVIWTCSKAALNELHFDIRQYAFIDWETPEDLAERLEKRIRAVVGVGPGALR